MSFVIRPLTGFDYKISDLASLMSFVRGRTISIVTGLDIYSLDYRFDNKSNSIGNLLMHIGSLEYFTIHNMFKSLVPYPSDILKWNDAIGKQMNLNLFKGQPLSFYLDSLNTVRNETFSMLSKMKDAWLYYEWEISSTEIMNNYYRLYHIIEDETSHCGQIKMIKKRIS